MVEEIRFEGNGGDDIRGEVFRPADSAGKTPAIVLVHEVFGLDAFARSAAQRMAQRGFTVLVPDLYSRDGVPGPIGDEACPAPEWDADTIRCALASLPDRRTTQDLEAAAGWLARDSAVDPRSIAVVGFGAGGTLAFLLGCQSRRVAAVALFYGRMVYADLSAGKPVQPLEMALNLSVPVLAQFGQEDASIAEDQVDAMESTLTQFSKSFVVERIPGVGQGFVNPLRAGWDESAAETAWEVTFAFLAESLGLSDG